MLKPVLMKKFAVCLRLGKLAPKMTVEGIRIKKFTRESAKLLHHACKGIVEMCGPLFQQSNDYVSLGQFFVTALKLNLECRGKALEDLIL